MFQRTHLNNFEDYFTTYKERTEKSVYFGRFTLWSLEVERMIERFAEETIQWGVCIQDKIGNPEEKHLSYYEEMMGMSYQLSVPFFIQELKRWLPRISEEKRQMIAESFYDILNGLARKGKNENMQRNAYIKYMCWLYYKFERLLQNFGNDKVPKLLYAGIPNEYEMLFLSVLSKAGCDILLVAVQGEEAYRKQDKESEYSENILVDGQSFPEQYSVLKVREQLIKKKNAPKIVQPVTEKIINTNTWIQGNPYEDVQQELKSRGSEERFFYNVFAGIYGVEESSGYYPELLKWKLKLESNQTEVLLVEESIKKPDYNEINSIRRGQYSGTEQLVSSLAPQIVCKDKKAENYGKAAFLKVMEKIADLPIQKQQNRAIELVCLMNRYLNALFGAGSHKAKKLFIYYGEIKTETEKLLLSALAKLPLDVLHINPEGKQGLEITDELFFAKIYPNTVKREKFPTDIKSMQFETVAYQAEQEVSRIMYQDTGMYRNRQFTKAVPVVLQNTYEEIGILWDQEAKYRPNFEVFEDKVMVPVIFSKVMGVPGNVSEYWEDVAKLCTEQTFVIHELPYLGNNPNPWKEKTHLFLQGGRLMREKVKNHPDYPYTFIREPMQDYMLEKLQELIDEKIIEGTGVDGTENLIVSTVLYMDKAILRLIQGYDFTKDIPKILLIHTKESNCTKEDSILLAYLSLIGFDIAMYVPTGYTGVERFYTKRIVTEHQIGEYKYDLRVPNLNSVKRSSESLVGRFFRRGR